MSDINHELRAQYLAAKHHHSPRGSRSTYRNTEKIDKHGLNDFLKWQLGEGGFRWPKGKHLEMLHPPVQWLQQNDNEYTITWIGHSSFLIQVAGLNILTDPVFSERVSPLKWAGPKRYMPPAMTLDDLPDIDVVLISHNHYDHLDEMVVKKLAVKGKKGPLFCIPLGVKSWFIKRGYENVLELDWWEQGACELVNKKVLSEVAFYFVPAQHFSGRGINDRNHTLWGGWVVEIAGKKIYFAGDTGYGPDFKQIGDVFNGFDLSLIPIGAYAPRWFMAPVHINPDEAVKIHQDVRSTLSIGMHWGTFILTSEPVDEPPRQLHEARVLHGVCPDVFRVMKHGEILKLEDKL